LRISNEEKIAVQFNSRHSNTQMVRRDYVTLCCYVTMWWNSSAVLN